MRLADDAANGSRRHLLVGREKLAGRRVDRLDRHGVYLAQAIGAAPPQGRAKGKHRPMVHVSAAAPSSGSRAATRQCRHSTIARHARLRCPDVSAEIATRRHAAVRPPRQPPRLRMQSLPSGTVTFLFTDIEGSTAPDRAASESAKGASRAIMRWCKPPSIAPGPGLSGRRRRILLGVRRRPAMRSARHSRRSARCTGRTGARSARCAFASACTPASPKRTTTNTFLRLALVRAQRVTAAGHGGQTLLSTTAAERVRQRLPAGTALRDLGVHKLRGLAETERIYELIAADLPSDFPPLRVEHVEASSATPLHQLVRGKLVGRGAELAAAQGPLGPGAAGARASGPALRRAGGGQDAPCPGPHRARAEERRDRAARRLLRVRGDHAVSAVRRGVARLGALAERRPAALGARHDRAGDRQVRARRSRRSSARSPPTRRSLRARSGCGCSTTPRVSCNRLPRSAACSCSSTTCIGPTRARCRCCNTCCAIYAITACSSSPPTARSSSTAPTRSPRRWSTGIASGWRRASPWAACRARIRARCSPRCSTRKCVSDEFTAALYNETEGNPFFVEEVVKSLIEQGEIYREERPLGAQGDARAGDSAKREGGHRPQARAASATRRWRPCAPPPRWARYFPFAELAAVSATGEDALLDALDEASNAQLVRAPAPWRATALPSPTTRSARCSTRSSTRFAAAGCTSASAKRWRRSTRPRRNAQADPGRAEEYAQDLAHHFAQAGDLERVMPHARARGRQRARASSRTTKR